MRTRLFTCIVLCTLIISPNIYAQEDNLSSKTISKVGTSVAQFLKLGISARTIGMGSAFVAVANDVSTMYTNPAGLSELNAYEVMFTHTNWLVDTKLDYTTYGEYLNLRVGDITLPHVPGGEPLRLECSHFIECVQKRTSPRSDGHDGLRVLSVLQAAQDSLKQGGAPMEVKRID